MTCGSEKSFLAALKGLSECVVLDFDAEWALVSSLHELAHEYRPVHFAMPGYARLVPLQWMGENANLVDAVLLNPHILGVKVKDFVLELGKGAGGIDMLKHEV